LPHTCAHAIPLQMPPQQATGCQVDNCQSCTHNNDKKCTQCSDGYNLSNNEMECVQGMKEGHTRHARLLPLMQ